jgi:hypothetical protein
VLKNLTINPSSELETERWLNENSASLELNDGAKTVSRYKLYQVTAKLYNKKEAVDSIIYGNTKNLFSGRDKIIIYDLTNMYFEGQMQSGNKADFGRSKQKRYDRRLIGLAISIDSMGWLFRFNLCHPFRFCCASDFGLKCATFFVLRAH